MFSIISCVFNRVHKLTETWSSHGSLGATLVLVRVVLVREYNRGWQAGVVTGVVSVVTLSAFVAMLRR